jgi:hypothetical protein
MKMYMGYDAYNGPGEGAVLIFANTAREAKKLLWKQNLLEIETYFDVRACLIKDSPYLEKEKLHNLPHVVIPEKSTCKEWGIGKIGGDGLCDLCRKERGDLYNGLE